MTRAKRQQRQQARQRNHSLQQGKAKPFIEHLHEFRKRLFWVVGSLLAGSAVGYILQQSLIGWLLRPAHDQPFIYTSPGGGINFIFQISIYFGIALTIPVIVYQLLQYLAPLMRYTTKRFILRSSLFSVVLAACGLTFGYFVGLPASIEFLTHQFQNQQITALLTIQEYMSFVMIYLIGTAVLFQIPLIMLCINRIKPLKPSKLLKSERYVIVAAFIIAALITPTPDIFNQVLIAGPMIAIYQLGVILVAIQNRSHRVSKIAKLRDQDVVVQAKRQAQLQNTIPLTKLAPVLASNTNSPTRARQLPVRPVNPGWQRGLDGIQGAPRRPATA